MKAVSFIFSFILAGYAWSELPPPKLPNDFLPVPPTRQETNYSCGAAASLAILRYWGAYDGPEKSLYQRLETTPKDGTEPPKIAELARAYGLRAHWKEDLSLTDLRKALKRGETAVLSLQAWRDEKSRKIPWRENWEDGHYVVLIGMDRHYAYAMDPSAPHYAYVPLAELQERWHDYENRHGPIRRYRHLAIFIRGEKPKRILSKADPLVRME